MYEVHLSYRIGTEVTLFDFELFVADCVNNKNVCLDFGRIPRVGTPQTWVDRVNVFS